MLYREELQRSFPRLQVVGVFHISEWKVFGCTIETENVSYGELRLTQAADFPE